MSNANSNSAAATESPFLPSQPSSFRFGIMLYVLLSIVAAGVALQIGLAMQVPAFRSEAFAWFGVTAEPVDRGSARRTQLYFLLVLYSLPVIFGGVVGILHSLISRIVKLSASHRQSIDEGFEME